MKAEIKAGQIWKSKYEYPDVGFYTIKILEDKKDYWDSIKISFTASLWEDGHWTDGEQSFQSILRDYDLVEE